MASRLDRLLQLLDTGASQTVRQAAAKQIASIATRGLRTDSGIEGNNHDVKPLIDSNGDVPSSPLERREDWSEVLSVLAKILPYLRSKNAETRNAASVTISHICTLAPVWTPLHPASNTVDVPGEFPSFSVESLLESNNLLLSSSGQEFSRPKMLGTPAELERARKEAKSRLGLDFLGDDDDDPDNTWTQELMDEAADVQVPDDSSTAVKSPDSKMDVASPISRADDAASPMSLDVPMPPIQRSSSSQQRPESRGRDVDDHISSPGATGAVDLSALSARERNRLKRKRRQEEGGGAAVINRAVPPSKIRVVEQEGRPTPKRAPSSPPSNEEEKIIIDPQKGGQVEAKEKSAYRALEAKPGHWVWAGMMKVLSVDLFNANWETRHGTTLAIREIVKIQGAHAGTQYQSSAEENAINHQKWCNDMAAKLLCVFVMDRFSDYVSDQVIAPVRESATQALAALLIHMPASSVRRVHEILLDMIKQDFPLKLRQNKREAAYAWQVRHAGLLGLKYEVAVRQDLIQQEAGDKILHEVVDAALLGLADQDDDVRSAAAGCLIPISRAIVENLAVDLPRILAVLWSCFESMKDDLSSSVSAVMDLLGSLVAFPQVMDIFGDINRSHSLNQLAPLLFPLFRHTISGVRLAVVHTLHNFITVQSLPGDWIDTTFLRLLFQNVLLEEREDVRRLSLQTWRLSLQRVMPNLTDVNGLIPVVIFRDWIECCTTPIGDELDANRLFILNAFSDSGEAHNVDKNMVYQDLSLLSEDMVWQARIATARCLAILANILPLEAQQEYFDLPLRHYFKSPSYFHKFMGATILQEWALEFQLTSGQPLSSYLKLAEELGNTVLEFIAAEPPTCYHETYPLLNQLCNTANVYADIFMNDPKLNAPAAGIPRAVSLGNPGFFTIASAKASIEWLDGLHNLFQKPKKKKDAARVDDAKKAIRELTYTFEERKSLQDLRVYAALAAAAISLKNMPPKLTPLIKGVTNSLKMESNVDLQSRSAHSLAAFLHLCATSSSPALKSPIDKVIKNLCVFLCQDDTHTPLFAKLSTKEKDILSFNKTIAGALSTAPLRPKEEPIQEVPEVAASHVMRRGGVAAFKQMSISFGSELFSQVPKIWQCISEELLKAYSPESTVEAGDNLLAAESGQIFLDTLTAFRDILPTLDPALLTRVESLFPSLLLGLQSRYSVVRQAVAKCFAVASDVMTDAAMLFLVERIIPLVDDADLKNRQGAVELLFHVVNTLQIKALPYIIFLVVPLLGRMSDADEDIRSCATNSFAALVKMVPLEAGLPDPPGFPEQLLKKRDAERKFLSQLLDGSQVEDYEIPVPINAELRKYQREGVNWLAFLAKYQLHGILCDDMGLGKTLQTICILASVHHERSQRKEGHLASLIICPPTLTNHWYHEIKKYASSLKPIIYAGPVKERRARLKKIKQFDVVITSYDVVRNDAAQICANTWLYCVLDEGHLIKNAKSKVSQAVKGVQAFHRLILSGTPIQNNVLELWSLFDFLMPGFLGNESSFNERFARPVLASKEGKSGAKGAESAARALEALHKQVLPFLLRRMKENVLNDLPPKIIQDYYCDVSPLQQRLFDEFQHSQASAEATDSVKSGSAKGHVFQALQYLRKVCNHPALVLKDGQPETLTMLQQVGSEEEPSTSVRDIMHAPKLLALRQLLLDCGIGQAPLSLDGGTDSVEELVSAPPQHRCLIFCQMKLMIDVIESDLFQKLMPTVSYMRLDGTVDAQKRHATVQTFNDDPSIDCLLLTTHIGGLGLTLTGADTVIFVEHDWNPMKDLQAMDRAHRLGQKRVVNVYRLITKGTLEEKIMGLQRFKLNIANSVVTQQNSGLDSMDTDLVLDLFKRTTDEEDAAAVAKKKGESNNGPVNQKNILSGLGDLHDDDEYAEMNLESFMSSIGR